MPKTSPSASLQPFFRPRSFAIIGASDDPRKAGGRPLHFAKTSGFDGRIFPINPRGGEIQGLPAYRSIADVDGDIDCAMIAIPASGVVRAAEECADAGVRAAVVFAAGFAEMGAEGRRNQERLTAIARQSGMRIVGPNCMGLFNTGANFYCTFTATLKDTAQNWPRRGGLGIVSQSGGVGIHVLVMVRDRGLGFSKWVTTGNECDVGLGECLAALAEDDETRTIACYMEGCRDPEALVYGLERAHANRKPVVILKVGGSELGAETAASHTAALAGSDRAFDALFRQYGVHRARTMEELIDLAAAFDKGHFPTSAEVGLVTISGGIGVLMADVASATGLEVPALPARAQKRLKELVPFAPVRNPVDTTAMWSNDVKLIGKFMEILLTDGGLPSLAVFGSTLGVTEERLAPFRDDLRSLIARFPERLFVTSTIVTPENRAELESFGALVYGDPTRAVEVIAALVRMERSWRRPARRPSVPRTVPRLGDAKLGEFGALDILERAGVPTVPRLLAGSAAAAARAAAALGFPAVLKIASPDIAHKTEIGGIALGIASQAKARDAFRSLVASARRAAPKARIDGVLVAPQIEDGVETIIGAWRDPVLGPVVLFGIGGVFVEVLDDVAMRIAPFGVAEARTMIGEIKGYGLLAGARGRTPADIAALARALSRLSLFAAANAGRFESIDINPFMVRPRGKGAVAVDALIVPAKAAHPSAGKRRRRS